MDRDANYRDVTGTHFQRLINTRAMLLKDAAGTLHLNVADYWYNAPALAGPWRVNATPSPDLVAAAHSAQTSMKSDPMLPSDDKRPAHAPDVIVAAQPAELVVTDWKP
ncbi:hypothetical protein M0D69_35090 [Caballeronia sp. SEWSISQ10-4 2]|uniref:hypothetical protein n=1 Tax=Caballeronia sp. SEWSISQ10-4 2 TaxID=2937438 RepID=UPI00264E3C27|nr:hypothetical protein [Caballeronia sp. SEWSISQ10-4 2]MDN7183149.1 hypothetical protein [Caballeronia sp. SEWSISQ10-4 2]